MTIHEIQTNEELRNHEFPVTRRKIFLAHAGVCPLPRRVAAAMNAFNIACCESDQEAALPPGWFAETRQRAARFVGADPTEVAFVGPTSLALSFIAGGLRFRRQQNILIYHDDYPSNVYPWMTLAERGVEVRLLNVRDVGAIRPRDVLGQIDENTRLVALASCHFVAGWRLELEALGAELRARNVLFSVDAIQTLGAFPTSAADADFLAADAHKWLLGPCAAGLLVVRRSAQEHLQPIVQGWHNLRSPDFLAQEQLVFKPDARRYEAGTPNLTGLFGLRAAIELLEEIGVDAIARELFRQRSWLIPALQAKGYTVLHAAAPLENAGGIISLRHPGKDLAALQAALEAAGIVTSLRSLPSGEKVLRLSPHFYNTDAELHRALEHF